MDTLLFNHSIDSNTLGLMDNLRSAIAIHPFCIQLETVWMIDTA